jgi:hypothetical protein
MEAEHISALYDIGGGARGMLVGRLIMVLVLWRWRL